MDDGNNWNYKSALMCTAEYFASNTYSDLFLNEIQFFIKETAHYNSFQQSRSSIMSLALYKEVIN